MGSAVGTTMVWTYGVVEAYQGLRSFLRLDPLFAAIPGAAMKGAYPSLLFYADDFGHTLTPIGLALEVEVTNLQATATRVRDYVVDVRRPDDWGWQWTRLQTLRAKSPGNLCMVAKRDTGLCDDLDFSKTSFERVSEQSLGPGASIRGWMFFEWPESLRSERAPEIEEVRLSLWTSAGTLQRVPLHRVFEPGMDLGAGGGSFGVPPPPHKHRRFSDYRISSFMDEGAAAPGW